MLSSEFDHGQLIKVLQLAFPDLPDTAKIVTTKSNPYYVGGPLGDYASGPIKIELQKYRRFNNLAVLEFTAGVHKPADGEMYAIILLAEFENSDDLALYTVTPMIVQGKIRE